MKENSMKLRGIQYGCGLCAPADWINYDSSLTLRLQKIPLFGGLIPSGPFGRFPANVKVGNIVKGLPEPDSSADLVYCSHVLEHLTLEEFRIALKNTYRLLKPGGTFRFVLPDMEAKAKAYLDSEAPDAIHIFMEDTYLGKKTRDISLKGKLRDAFRNDQHLWMWDYKSMKVELEAAGFREVRRAYYGDSEIKNFSAAEERTRWEDELGVECKK